jgi:aspartate/methionine/tyrosine aminotransferase
MFSSRLPDRLRPNQFTKTIARLRAAGTPLVDLTVTNPTLAGLRASSDVLALLADPDATIYRPEPLGTAEARESVAKTYTSAGWSVLEERVLLTASTSEAYSYLFKLLCNPGDEVLAPEPSYPLFDHLAALDSVTLRPYVLRPPGAWSIDRPSLQEAIGSRTRAVLVVSPNNPTGSLLAPDDRDWLIELASAYDLAIVCDEVFAEYPLSASPTRRANFLDDARVLSFTLGGLSKLAALPQLKIAWTIVNGPACQVEAALDRLDVIADAYLSVSTPVQLGLPQLLRAGEGLRVRVLDRLRQNLATLDAAVAGCRSITFYRPDAGWSAVLRVPAIESDESLVLRLAEEAHVIVHPGYFFDFHDGTFIVLSLLPDPDQFSDGVSRLVRFVEALLR